MPYTLQPNAIKQKWQDYQEKCDNHVVRHRYRNEIVEVKKPRIYCFDSFCCFLGIDEDELKEYEDNKNYKATFKKIRYEVLSRKLAALVNGEGSASGLIFDLKCNYGLYPKLIRQGKKVVDVTIKMPGHCGDNLTRPGGAFAAPGLSVGEEDGYNSAFDAQGDINDTGVEIGESTAGGTPEAGQPNNGQEPPPPPPAAEPLRPGTDNPVSLNKQQAQVKREPRPEDYATYADYWAHHCFL